MRLETFLTNGNFVTGAMPGTPASTIYSVENKLLIKYILCHTMHTFYDFAADIQHFTRYSAVVSKSNESTFPWITI